ncbi:hypothetical protein [Achromobacter xylosoxidans]|uniref:hypothetical protein n=1 Tax=Alcaligenes xylosoxydans xylosoxydans TaxID=85698 RepID=UPI003D2AE700
MTNSYDVAHGLSQVHPGPEYPVEIAQHDDTLARTGNTARDQEMYATGIRTGEENTKHNAAIRTGVPDGWKLVPIEPTIDMLADADETGNVLGPRARRIYAAMLNAAPAAPGASTVEDAQDEQPYCYALETRGHHGDQQDVLLDVEYNGTDSFSGGRTGGIPLYRRTAPAAGDARDLTLAQKYEDACIVANANAQDAERYRSVRNCPTLVMSYGDIGGGQDLDARVDAHRAAIAAQAGGKDGDH